MFLGLAITALALAQAPAQGTRSQVSGTITAVDAGANRLSLKSDKGDALEVSTTDRTLVLRIPAGETDPKKGTKVALSSLAAGDRAVVVGPAPTGNTWNASTTWNASNTWNTCRGDALANRCSCTKRGIRSGVMPWYQVPSG